MTTLRARLSRSRSTSALAIGPAEFAALCGVSYPTVWRRIKRGEIKTVVIGGVKVIPRAFAIECGLITDSAS